MTVFQDDFSKEVYEQTYKFQGLDKDINDTQLRVARNLASLEVDVEHFTKEFIKIQENFAFMPGGRITSNAGTGLKGTTYINCFVDGFLGSNQDSMEGIFDTLRRQGLILKSEGGYGFNSDVMRPRGGYIDGIANESPGSVQMLDMWDTQSAVITKGSGAKSAKGKVKIRKGAQMVTKSMWHPDIEEFITAKQTEGRLTKFNMSVLCDDDFMTAVKDNKPWNLKFPDFSANKELYNKEWDGNIYLWESKGYPVKVYKTYENANELYDLIMSSTYTRNEPGILFVSIINKYNNLWYCEYISATNPCGEQLLPIGGVCLLGSINLTQFVDGNGLFDFEKFREYIPLAVRMLDNVNDITHVPLDTQRDNLLTKRRIGLGILGYGSLLLMLKKRYGSMEALEFTNELMHILANEAYKASAMLAKEKGAFPLFDKEKFLKSKFVQENLSDETKELIAKYGMRNSHLLSIQPTGNSSVFANNVSGGQEPVFMFEYIRTSMQPYPPEGMEVPKNIDFNGKKFDECATQWVWKKEGDENVLSTFFEDQTWKIDKNRGLLKESIVNDYGVRWLKERGEWDELATWASNTYTLSVDDHTNTMKVFAMYVDSAMSKTVNLPADYPYEDFKNLYMDWWKTGFIKGGTTYREGTMTTVLSAIKKEEGTFDYHDAPKRPKEIEAELNVISVKGEKYGVILGFLEGKPYEIFAFPAPEEVVDEGSSIGKLVKIKRGQYDYYSGDNKLRHIEHAAVRPEEQVLTRLISGMLRHGANPEFIIEQIDKCPLEIVSFGKAISRTLKKYIKLTRNQSEKWCEGDCKIVHEEGCSKCMTCGESKCS